MHYLDHQKTGLISLLRPFLFSLQRRLLLICSFCGLYFNGLSTVLNGQCTVSDINCQLTVYWEFPDRFGHLMEPFESQLSNLFGNRLSVGIKNGIQKPFDYSEPLGEFSPVVEILESAYSLSNKVDATGDSSTRFHFDELVKLLEQDIELALKHNINNISIYLVHYRLAYLKSALYSLKLKVYNKLYDMGKASDEEISQLIALTTAYTENLYRSGLLNGHRKNNLTNRHQLIEQMLAFLSRNDLNDKMLWIDRLLKISRIGEFSINKEIMSSSGNLKSIVSELLYNLGPFESKVRKGAFLGVGEISNLLKNRNALRERYLWLVNEFYKTKYVPKNMALEGTKFRVSRVAYFVGSFYTFQYVQNGQNRYLNTFFNNDLNEVLNPLTKLFMGRPDYLKGGASEPHKLRVLLNKLSKMLDLDPMIKSSDKLLVDKDGRLNLIPFELLIDNKGKYLFEDFLVGYETGESTQKGNIKNLDFFLISGSYEGSELELQYGLREKEYLEKEFRAGNVDIKNVNRSRSLNALHVVTHQVYDDLNEPVLLLSENDSIYIRDFYQIKNAPIILNINSCASLSGYLVSGEGSRSFGYRALEIGSRQSLANLWNVEDANIHRISKDYLRRLNTGVSSMTSLQKSKKKFIAEADSYYKHPFFWAALVHLGEDIQIKRNSYWFLFLLILLPIILTKARLKIYY